MAETEGYTSHHCWRCGRAENTPVYDGEGSEPPCCTCCTDSAGKTGLPPFEMEYPWVEFND